MVAAENLEGSRWQYYAVRSASRLVYKYAETSFLIGTGCLEVGTANSIVDGRVRRQGDRGRLIQQRQRGSSFQGQQAMLHPIGGTYRTYLHNT